LVVVQVALALVMLVGSGLMIRTFQNLRGVEPGFTDPAGVQTVRLVLPFSTEPEKLVRTQEQLLERLAAIPGVTSAAYADSLPLQGASGVIVAPEDVKYESRRAPADAANHGNFAGTISDARYAVTRRPRLRLGRAP
jgi:hypothetical protein